jgi:hypothetical protein
MCCKTNAGSRFNKNSFLVKGGLFYYRRNVSSISCDFQAKNFSLLLISNESFIDTFAKVKLACGGSTMVGSMLQSSKMIFITIES